LIIEYVRKELNIFKGELIMEKFTEQIKLLSERTAKLKDTLNTEEATKTALVMPFSNY
jgi:hypothetical protein